MDGRASTFTAGCLDDAPTDHDAVMELRSIQNQKQNVDVVVDDPHNIIDRFVRTHKTHFDQALREIRNGRKCSCWSWYVLPTAPWVVNGVERGSWTNAHYALRGKEQVRAFLEMQHDGVDLRSNYLAIIDAMAEQVEGGVSFRHLLGVLDDPKARSSVKLFERHAHEHGDAELQRVCQRLLDLIGEKRDGDRDDSDDDNNNDDDNIGKCGAHRCRRRRRRASESSGGSEGSAQSI
eukprot:PhM_4_TR17565/c0_g1_i1/m.2583